MKLYNFITDHPPLVLILSIIVMSMCGAAAALLGEYYWGLLGRLGVTAPLSWLWGGLIGLFQVVAVVCYVSPKLIEWDRRMSGLSDE